ncbi:hypothetical protein OSB04_022220 [Centaurea solstitialis]|uniref:Uncharacterized protein n=1 Tax=Centaurea solstitialis TaxID=347529 RepID=A0AA38W7F6_9ASTR|nr:hypothetical protein OSB04_022220 [Centaurea solstitialis]
MAATHSLILISAANISFHSRLRLLSPPPPSSWSHPLLIKCSMNAIGDTESSKNLINNSAGLSNLMLSGSTDENWNGLEKNTQRVESEIENQETEANKMMEYINASKPKSPRSVSSSFYDTIMKLSEAENGAMVTERKAMNKSKEKLESVKAALIAAIVGTLASLPISLIHKTNAFELTVSTASTMIACALYGATFRYVVRRDLDDFHLKTGTSAAFGIVKGVATLDGRPDLEHEAGSFLSQAFGGAVCVSENVVIFLVAAAGLDICYKMGILSPFPVERSVSRTKM